MVSKLLLRKISGRFRRYAGQFNECYVSWIRYIDGPFGEKKRYSFYKKHLRFVGENVRFDTGVYIYGMEYVSIGANTHIDKNCIIIGSPENLDLTHRIVITKLNDSELEKKGEVKIGKECHISQNCMIYGYGGVLIGDNCVMSAGSKIYSLTSMYHNPSDTAEIISIVPYSGKSPTLIGSVSLADNVWIGIDVIISPGVSIEKNSFVRSRSIVMGSFGENSYIAGDPAVFVRPRFG